MSLRLYYHPLSSFCHKVLIALYENDVPFTGQIVDLGNAEDRAAFMKVWPLGKFPVLRDEARDWVVPESTIVIEYLEQHRPGRTKLLPADPDRARQVRMRDRFWDNYVHLPMQKVVGDRLRPADARDPLGIAQAREQIRASLALAESGMGTRTWAMGDDFTLADCAAAPALHYVDRIMDLGPWPRVAAYLKRLRERPSYARVLREAAPYDHMFPRE